MKLSHSLVAAALLTSSLSVLAADGTIQFQGHLFNETCNLKISGSATADLGTDKLVTLPKVVVSSLAKDKSTAGSTPFTLELIGADGNSCKTDSSNKYAALYFEPSSQLIDKSSDVLGLLSLEAGSQGGGVSFQLLNSELQPLDLMSTIPTDPSVNDQHAQNIITDTDGKMNLFVQYYSHGDVKPGIVNSNIQYTIIYK